MTVSPDVSVAAATLQYVRDDGVVITVNGTEVRRDNVADGPITHTTPASAIVFGDLETEIITVELDPNLFVAGTNVIAVSLHNASASGDLTFDAQLDLRVGSSAPDTSAPEAPPALTVASVTDGSVALAWEAATDNVGVVGYEILRDGTVVGSTSGLAFVDGGLAPETTYGYEVVALDAAGNTGPAAGPVQATTTATPLGDVVLVGAGTQWAFDDRGVAPPPDWTTALAAPAIWKTGTTEIGVGDGGETTVVTNRPVIFARTVFSVGDPTAVGALTLDLLADDGAVAYLNGVEIVRDNVGPGPVDQNTPASSYRWTVADETTLNRWVVPAGLLQSGPNVLAVSIHNGPGSSDLSFDAVLTASYQLGPDTEAPGAPTGVVVSDATADSLTISWNAATDNVGVAEYRLQRDGVDIVTLPGRTHVDVGLSPATSYVYTVVAVDVAGNVGPASDPVTGFTAGATTDTIAIDHLWRYLDTGVDPGPGWAAPGFDDSGWPAGAAELGAGDGDEVTVVTNRPVVWFRTSFAVADPAALARVTLGLRADDGAVVYLNGIELVRDNVGPGPVTGSTPAASYRWTVADESALRSFDLPVGALVAGTNVLAISVHNGSGSTDLSFAATLETEDAAAPDTQPPSAPGTPSVVAADDTSVSLTWAPATDDVAVDRYEIRREGATVGTSFTTGFVETGLMPETTYTYRVRAIDASGNVGPLSDPVTVNTAPAVVEPALLIAETADWRYLDSGVAPDAAWVGVGFDDSEWLVGPAELGAEDGDEATVVTNRPVVWFRHTFDVADAAAFASLELDLLADDGAVVFVNGVEVLRDNVGPGPLDATTPALGYRWGAAEQELRTFTLDPAILVDGTNVVAVSVHNGLGSTDLSFAATLTAG
ncbi:MAG: fibronectin type III domain-containing protein [Acidimicrobiales bacterium]